MAWHMDGTYFETCSCDALCPCTWSGLTARATTDRCNALLAFHVASGEVDGVDISDLNWAMLIDTPPVMSEGNWRVGVVLDERASEEQQAKLGAVLGGELGGPPAMLGALIGEMLGVQVSPIDIDEHDGTHRLRIGDDADIEVRDFAAGGNEEPVVLQNVFHPAASTLTVAPATSARVSLMGVEFGREGASGFAAPFSWSS
jgi:hypothetical protein